MYKYPYGDSQQLNLDWILAKIKELEAGGSGGAADLEEVSNALVALSFNFNTQYRRYDYCYSNGKLYRCLSDTSGVFDPSAWQEVRIGEDLAVLTRWINAIDAAAVVDVKFDTSGTNGKIQQKYHDEYHDVVEVDYAPVQNSKRPLSSNAGYELNGAINGKMNATPPSIEMYPASGSSHGGYIDFHYGGNTGIDYTTRLMENTSGNIHIYGSMTLGSPLPVSSGGTGNTSVDTTPTANSTKMVTSGGVYSAIAAAQSVTSHELIVHSGTTAQELGRAIMLVYGKLFLLHGIVTVTTALSQGTVIYDLPSYNYGLANMNNNPIVEAANGSYTTVGVDNTNKTLKVTYNGGMQTGRFEMFLMGWIN